MRTLDTAALDDRELEARGGGDPRRRALRGRCPGARRRCRCRRARGRRAPDPVVPGRDSLGQRPGHRHRARRRGGGRRSPGGVDLVDSRVRRAGAASDPRGRPAHGVGWYGESKIEAEWVAGEFARRGLETVIVRPKTFVGPERLGVFEILFDWIREGRRIPILGDGAQPLPAAGGRGPRRRGDPHVRRTRGRRGSQRRRRKLRDRPRRPPGVDRPRRLGIEVVAAPGRSRRADAAGARTSAPVTACRVALSRPRTRTPSSRSTRPGGCSAGSRRSRTPGRCARRTTGTWPTSTRCEPPGRPTACRGISRRSGCSSA